MQKKDQTFHYGTTLRSRYELLRSQLALERATFEPHWRDLSDNILPRRSRFYTMDVNRGDRRNQRIIDSTASLAVRTLRSGMMSGITSPARPWFQLTTPDPDLSEVPAVKDWLFLVGQRISTVFLTSNLYQTLPTVYGDLGTFGTSALLLEEDFKNVIRTYAWPIGSYYLANDDRLQIRVFMREFRLTIRQLVMKFGGQKEDGSGEIDWSNFSPYIEEYWRRGHYEAWVDVVHCIKGNEDYDPRSPLAEKKRYSSVYYERGVTGTTSYAMDFPDKYLRVSGYDYFPVLCPRWEITGEDVYGTNCPGMEALGDIRQLQLGERRAMQAIEKMVNPPMKGPVSLKNQKASLLPGDITYVDERDGQKGFTPVHEVNAPLQELENKQQMVRSRIQRCFYEDLFLMMSESDRRDITAREIDERHEEKLLALGPVLEQLNQDLLDPLIDITFQMMDRQGLIPPAPQELQGLDLKIEYISVMAQAQKMVGISNIERFAQFTTQVAATNPTAADKVNTDVMIDRYGDMTSVPPGVVRTDEDVATIRQQRAQQAAQQSKMEQLEQGSKAAKNLSDSNVQSDNALSTLLNRASSPGQ